MTAREERQRVMDEIAQARAAGARLSAACREAGRTVLETRVTSAGATCSTREMRRNISGETIPAHSRSSNCRRRACGGVSSFMTKSKRRTNAGSIASILFATQIVGKGLVSSNSLSHALD